MSRQVNDGDADPVLPHQREDARWIAEKGTRYLAHEMRVGKTATAIRADDLMRAGRVLWLTTGTARIGHARAWSRYSPLDHDCRVINTGSDLLPDRGVIITSYDLAAGPLYDRLMAMQFDVLNLDEAHKLKSPKAKRTVAILGERTDGKDSLSSRAQHIVPMSGTPAPNHPGELWSVLHALFPQSIERAGAGRPMRQFEFEQRFCKTKWTPFGNNRKIVGGKNLPELAKRIAPYMRRRTFAETYEQATGVEIEMLYVDAQSNLDELRALEEGEIRQKYERALKIAQTREQREAVMTEIEKTVGLRLRRLTGLAKAPGVVDWAHDYFGEYTRAKLVLFGHHREVLDMLCDGLRQYRPIRVSGGVSPKAKGEAEELFRTDPNRRVFVGNLLAAGEAIDLSAADDVVLVESSWVPGENDQAIKRIMNLAKRRENIAWFATLAGSIDEHIQRTNARKTADLVQLFG